MDYSPPGSSPKDSPSPWDLLSPGIEPAMPGEFFTPEPLGKPTVFHLITAHVLV